MQDKTKRATRSTEAQAQAAPPTKMLIEQMFSKYLSNLWGEVNGTNQYFLGLTVSLKSDGTYLGVARCTDAQEARWVCFGSGSDFVGALVALSTAIAKDAWREDKFSK